MMKLSSLCLSALALPVFAAASSAGETKVLTFGGGPYPAMNQISLETNIAYFRSVLEDLGRGDWSHDVYYADGGGDLPLVQVLEPMTDELRYRELVANLFTPNGNLELDLRYRPIEIESIDGPNNAVAMDAWFAKEGQTLHDGDGLMFYFTGHGLPDDERGNPPRNAKMDMWNSGPVDVVDFTAKLDTLDPAADVFVLMVQCYSGGFANIIYNGGKPEGGLSEQSRLGYFSTVGSRMAAGCTPDIAGDDYREFSTAFFAALSGTSRAGQPVEQPDYDGDGVTSLAEAFGHVLVTSDTIDIPTSTIDVLLRDYSAVADAPDDAPEGEAATQPALLPITLPLAELQRIATSAERVALQGLVERLDVDGDDIVADTYRVQTELAAQQQAIETERAALLQEFAQVRRAAATDVALRFPELPNPWLPGTPAMFGERIDELRRVTDASAAFARYVTIADRLDELVEAGSEVERRDALAERLRQLTLTVVLAENLPHLAPPEVVAYYERLREREAQPL